jgi:hypothetical protein
MTTMPQKRAKKRRNEEKLLKPLQIKAQRIFARREKTRKFAKKREENRTNLENLIIKKTPETL